MVDNSTYYNFVHTMKDLEKNTEEQFYQFVVDTMNGADPTVEMEEIGDTLEEEANRLSLDSLKGSPGYDLFLDQINRKKITTRKVAGYYDWHIVRGNDFYEGMPQEEVDTDGGEYSDWIQNNEKESF